MLVPESDVLIAATIFLVRRKVTPYRFSVAAGRNLASQETRSRLNNAFATIGRQAAFSGNGADILGVSESEWWAIECKGAGGGKPPTLRTNFDRALASAVSYYEDGPPDLPARFQNATVCIGLALPAHEAYMRELRRRVRFALRRRLNLWILLYEAEGTPIRAVPPTEENPF